MKANYKKKLTAAASVLTAGMMLFSAGALTGCGNKSGNGGSGSSVQLTEEQKKSMSYKISDVELPLEQVDAETGNCYYGSVVFKNGKIYGVRSTSNYNEESGDSSINTEIVIVDTNGTVVSTFPVYNTASFSDGYANIQGGLTITDEGNVSFILYESTMDSETYESTEKYSIKTYSPDGTEVSSLPIEGIISEEEMLSGNMWFSGCFTGNDGNIYCNLSTCIRVLDPTGKILFTTKPFDSSSNAWISSFFVTNTGVPAISVYTSDAADNYTSKIMEIDAAAQDFGKEYTLPSYISSATLYNGGGDYLAICQGETGLKGLKYDASSDSFTTQNVIDLLGIGIDTSQMSDCTISEDGTVVVSRYSAPGSKCYVSLATPSEDADPSKKTPITIGCYYLDWNIRSTIANFNKSSDKYVINVQSYSESNDTQDYEAALTKFNNELLSGNIPDILLINEAMPVASYEAKGLFTDLYEFIDNDSSISRDDLAQNVLTALDNNGKLYTIGNGFQLNTFIAKKEIVGDRSSITFDEANDYLSKMPEGARLFTQTQTSGELLNWGIITGGFVDYANGTCSFDSPEFKSLIEFTKAYPAEIDYEKLSQENANYWEDQQTDLFNGRTLFNSAWVSNYTDSRWSIATMGGDVSFTGFPTANSNGGSAIMISSEVAISSKSKCKDGAWEFVKACIVNDTSEDGYFSSFPTYLPILEKMKSKTLSNAASEHSDEVYYVGSTEVKLDPIDQAYIDTITNAVYSVSNSYHFDTSLMDIIHEEVNAFYNGTKNADETAAMVQSRASIYLSEQT